MTTTRPVAALVLLAVLSGLSACSDDGSRDDAGPAAPKVPELEAAWTSDEVADATVMWSLGDTVVVGGDDRLAGLDVATGETRWSRTFRHGICRWPEAPNAEGTLAVLLAREGRPRTCVDVAALDLDDGRLRWRRSLDGEHPVDWDQAEYDGVSVGDRTVAVTDSVLSAAVLLDLADGEVRTVRDDAELSSDGAHLIGLTRGPTPGDGSRTATVHDLDTGRRSTVFRVGDASNLVPVLTDPLVIGTERGRWGSDLFLVRPDGVTRVGRGVGSFTASVDGRLVLTYPGALVVVDESTGEEQQVAVLDPQEEAVGIADGRLITLDAAVEWLEEPTTVVRRVDPAQPADPVVLGSLPRTAPLGVAGDLLVTGASDGVTSYRLPAEGRATSDYVEALDWEEWDLRPADVLDACRAVGGPARALVGIDAAEPVHGSCWWGGGENFQVDVTAHLPDARRTAVEAASEGLELESYKREAVPDLGDGAWMSTGDAPVVLTVRYRNVLVRVRSTADQVTPARARQAALGAADDVLTELARRADPA